MLFNSVDFFIFFPVVTIIYFLLKHNTHRWLWLLAASCYFYMSFIPAYLLILVAVILIDYSAGILIGNSSGSTRKAWLITSLTANIGLLAIFKYYDFLNFNAEQLAHFLHLPYAVPYLSLILPIGLSFHTFQSMSYTIEVYRGKFKPERNFIKYSLYVLFYPQLVAGPIERPQNILPQFEKKYDFNLVRVTDGLKLMLWGLFKKMVIADRLSLYVDAVYNNPVHEHGWPVILATLFFTFQIYCDFSGYSDIAIGAAQVMGIRLMDNFNRPYFSKTVSEFWGRWHISLSTWFRDYLYIPLGGNRVSKLRNFLNLFIVFLVSGLWHGASWTFIIWGALHGTYLIIGRISRKTRSKFNAAIGLNKKHRLLKYTDLLITFSLVAFAWIFFRAKTLSAAVIIIKNMFSGLSHFKVLKPGLGPDYMILSVAGILIMESVHLLQRHYQMRHMLRQKPFIVRWAVYNIVVIMILFFGVYTRQQFIYFQF